MSAVGDVFVLRMKTLFLGEACWNVFHYRVSVSSGLNGAPHLISAFDGGVLADLKGILSNQATVDQLEAINWGNPSEFQVATGGTLVNETGTVAGSYLPPRWVFGINYNRRQPGQHSGSKRFSGVPEDRVINGAIDPAFAGAFNAAKVALGLTINFGTTSFVPFVAHRYKNKMKVYPPIGTPITSGYDANGMGEWELRTQRTR